MTTVYPEKLIRTIQDCVNKKSYTVSREFSTFSDLPMNIYTIGLKASRKGSGANKSLFAMFDPGVSKITAMNIKTSGLYNFYGKDWKQESDETKSALLYKELDVKLKDDISIIVLVRKLTDEDKIKTFKQRNEKRQVETFDVNFEDIKIRNVSYVIIKMFIKNYETYDKASTLEDYSKIDAELSYLSNNMYGHAYIEGEEEIEEINMEDDSEMLF